MHWGLFGPSIVVKGPLCSKHQEACEEDLDAAFGVLILMDIMSI